MGLDCSHDAFHGAYSAFNRLRQVVAQSIKGSYGPHYLYHFRGEPAKDKQSWFIRDESLDENHWYWGPGYSKETNPGLYEFFCHSDCDGEISPEMCVTVADELEAILPKIEAIDDGGAGHIAARGGYTEVVRKFIAGCREAASAGEPLDFHL